MAIIGVIFASYHVGSGLFQHIYYGIGAWQCTWCVRRLYREAKATNGHDDYVHSQSFIAAISLISIKHRIFIIRVKAR